MAESHIGTEPAADTFVIRVRPKNRRRSNQGVERRVEGSRRCFGLNAVSVELEGKPVDLEVTETTTLESLRSGDIATC